MQATYLKKVSTDCDLTEAMVSDGISTMAALHMGTPTTLLARTEDAFVAGRLAQKFDLSAIILPDEILAQDAWALASEHSVLWSPGA